PARRARTPLRRGGPALRAGQRGHAGADQAHPAALRPLRPRPPAAPPAHADRPHRVRQRRPLPRQRSPVRPGVVTPGSAARGGSCTTLVPWLIAPVRVSPSTPTAPA